VAEIIKLSQVGALAGEARRLGKTVVLVTGVFDLLHQEHQKFLQAAKNKGDFLLVGVETDARVKKLKGKNRPIWKLDKRLKELTKVKAVDYVFSLPSQFDKLKAHEALIAQIKPDILAISSHTPHQEVKKDLVKKYGGELLVVLSHNPEVSTTKLVTTR